MRSKRRQTGIALIVVLWTVALLALFVGSLSRSARIDSRSAGLNSRLVQAQAVAEAGLWATVSAIVSSDADVPIAYTFDVAGETADVRVEPVTARVNVNAADLSTIAALLDGSALTAAEPHSLVARIADWRDADSQREEGGFEDRDYEAVALPNGAKDAPFYTVDELRHVAGIGEATFDQLAPFLTVFGGESAPDLRFASDELVRALGGNRSASGEPDGAVALPSVGVMSVRAASVVGGARADLVAVVYFTGHPQPPYQILSWHSGVPGVLEN